MYYKATITIGEDAGHLLIRISGPAACEVKESFKAHFRGHQRTWRAGDACWSLNGSLRRRLDLWLDHLPGVTVEPWDAERKSA